MDNRHLTRIYVIQELFQLHFPRYGGDYLDISKLSTDLGYDTNEVDKKRAESIIKGVEENLKAIDQTIEKLAPQWPLEQIVRTDIEILRLAIYEGFISKTVPEKVAIDEGIELAREFGGENSRKFVSGVLGTLFENNK